MKKSRLITFCSLAVLFFATPDPNVEAQDFIQRAKNFGRDIIQKHKSKRAAPVTGQDNAIENLASEIDWLENYMDEYGSVSAKQPDIWGESRLTKYRHEVEEQLSERIDDFTLRDNASVVRADIAQLASIISIGSIADSSIADFKAQQTQFNEAQSRSLDIYAAQLQAYQQSLEAFYAAERARGENPAPTAPTAPTIGAGPTAPPIPDFSLPTGLNLPAFPTVTPNSNPLGASNLEPVIELNQRKRYLDHLNQLRRVNEGDDTSDAPGYALNLVRIPVSILPGRATRRGYGAKVTVTANPITSRTLLPTTFRNLAVNDLVDLLGLPVLRLAEEGVDAGKLQLLDFLEAEEEVSMALGNAVEQMPTSWPDESGRSLRTYLEETITSLPVDVVDGQAAFSTKLAYLFEYLEKLHTYTKNAGEKDSAREISEIAGYLKWSFKDQASIDGTEGSYLSNLLKIKRDELAAYQASSLLSENIANSAKELTKMSSTTRADNQLSKLEDDIREFLNRYNEYPEEISFLNDYTAASTRLDNIRRTIPKSASSEVAEVSEKLEAFLDDANKLQTQSKIQTENFKSIASLLGNKILAITGSLDAQFASASASGRNSKSRFPISPSLVKSTIGRKALVSLAASLGSSYKGRHVVSNQSSEYKGQVHLLDARKYLSNCFDSAFEVLSHSNARELLVWTIEGGQYANNLGELICNGNIEAIKNVRFEFYRSLQNSGVSLELIHHCWCMSVEMSLLNKRLNEDVHQHAITKGDCDCTPNCYNRYYLPMPECSESELEATDPEFCAAADAFCNYVKCRWPIHVFTIDPVHQEQNVSEASAVRRELSIAAALAFTSGKINLNQLTRYQRQVQEDISTVGLNRTQTGFMHSNDTFGWQFSPRVQTRKPQGSLKAFGETVFGRGADANWKEATLEPGMRECTAIVLMPSFVPYCDFDIRTNWFQINRPTHTDMSMSETMKLSRSVTRMRNAKYACKQCEHLYRPGEMDRLLNRVEQLERMIPLQSLRAQIPYENTLGGFDLFSNGLTDLGPRVEGWYGAPGIVIGFNKLADDDKKRVANRPQSTSLFLVADNLSVNQTEIIAGGLRITDKTMISRDVVRIGVPDAAQVVEIDGKPYVAVYIATPYGVTNHLHIPVVTGGLEGTSAKTLADLQKELEAKIAATPFSWSKKETVDYELCFGMPNAVCEVTNLKLTNKQAKFKLEDSLGKLAKLAGNQGRQFSLVGALIGPDKKPFGSPVLLKSGQKFDSDGTFEWEAMDLFEGDLLAEIESKLAAKFFEKETKLALKLETYILFKEGANGFSSPVKIGGEIDAVVTLNQLCTAKVTVHNSITAPPVSPITVPTPPSSTPDPGGIELKMDGSSNLRSNPNSLPQREASLKPSLSSRRYQMR